MVRLPLLLGRCGLGDRKVLSVMDPWLPLLRRLGLPSSSAVPEEETEAVRARVRFVWTSATFVGVVGRARKAAAAAADDRLLDGSRCLKTAAAAVAALGLAVARVRTCWGEGMRSVIAITGSEGAN